MTNAKIIEILTRLMILRYLTGDDTESIKERKQIAYQKVIDGIRILSTNALSVDEIVNQVPGIGKNIRYYLTLIFSTDDPIRTGIPDIDNLLITPILQKGETGLQETGLELFNKIAILAQFVQVPGYKIKRSIIEYNKGSRTISQLVSPGSHSMSPNSHTGIQMGISHITFPQIGTNKNTKRIPYEKITQFGDYFKEMTSDLDLFFTITGSYRRKQKDSGDIDMVVMSKSAYFTNQDPFRQDPFRQDIELTIEIVLQRLKERGILIQTRTSGRSRPTYILYFDTEYPEVQLDFLKIHDPTEYPYAILYFTGNASFNEKMKAYARKFGFKLGNTDLTDKNGEKIIVKTEEDIFSFFKIPYILPENRTTFPYH